MTFIVSLELAGNSLTSSMNRTPGMMVALPSSRHSATLLSICSRTSDRISPVSPAKSARKPCRGEDTAQQSALVRGLKV